MSMTIPTPRDAVRVLVIRHPFTKNHVTTCSLRSSHLRKLLVLILLNLNQWVLNIYNHVTIKFLTIHLIWKMLILLTIMISFHTIIFLRRLTWIFTDSLFPWWLPNLTNMKGRIQICIRTSFNIQTAVDKTANIKITSFISQARMNLCKQEIPRTTSMWLIRNQNISRALLLLKISTSTWRTYKKISIMPNPLRVQIFSTCISIHSSSVQKTPTIQCSRTKTVCNHLNFSWRQNSTFLSKQNPQRTAISVTRKAWGNCKKTGSILKYKGHWEEGVNSVMSTISNKRDRNCLSAKKLKIHHSTIKLERWLYQKDSRKSTNLKKASSREYGKRKSLTIAGNR